MVTKYVNTEVILDDQQERFEADKDFNAKVRYDSEKKQWLVELAVIKSEVKTDKPQPVKVFADKAMGISGTIKVNGNLKVGLDLSREKAEHYGLVALREKLDYALEEVYAYESE